MPRLQNEILPTYAPQGFSAMTIHTGLRGDKAAELLESAGVTLPMAMDIESEVFRRYRVPGEAFPLNVVIDRDGNVAHVDNGPNLDASVAAIEAAL